MEKELPITGYRVFFPDAPPEDFPTVDAAWDRRCQYQDTTGQHAYVHTLRLGSSEFPVFG